MIEELLEYVPLLACLIGILVYASLPPTLIKGYFEVSMEQAFLVGFMFKAGVLIVLTSLALLIKV